MTKPATNQEAPKDELPEIDDDVEIAAVDAPLDATDEAASEQDSAPAKKLDPRAELVQRYRELRNQQAKADQDAEDAADDEDQPVEAAETPPAPVAAVAKPAVVPATVAEDDPEVELKVHGETRRMKRSEVQAHAQRALASDDILGEAKRHLEDARAQRGKSSASADQRSDDDGLNAHDDDPSHDETTPANQRRKIDDAKLEDIVERIQVGDKAEGRQALAELVELVGASGSLKPEQIGQMVSQEIARVQYRNEIEEAVTGFKGKYQSIIDDPELLQASFSRLNGELKNDLRALGMKDADLAKLNDNDLMNLHQGARAKGQSVRSYGSLFEKVGGDMATKYGAVIGRTETPPPAQTSTPQSPATSSRLAERVDRKRSAAVQPRTAGVRTQTGPQQKTKTREEVVADMRRSRGFS